MGAMQVQVQVQVRGKVRQGRGRKGWKARKLGLCHTCIRVLPHLPYSPVYVRACLVYLPCCLSPEH